MTSSPHVVARVEGAVGRIGLAKAALDLEIIGAVTSALVGWRSDPAVSLVLIDHVGERGFVAGGDAVGLATSGNGDGVWGRAYFAEQQAMVAVMAAYPKPIVTVADGATLGGGLGLALAAAVTVATERTMVAFMETSVGFIPDVGGAWALPRLKGGTGLWLTLSGTRLKGGEVVARGLADVLVESGRLEELKAALVARPADYRALLDGFAQAVAAPTDQAQIDRLFVQPSLGALIAALEADGGALAAKSLEAIRKSSPLAVAAAFELLKRGAGVASAQMALELEYRLNGRLISAHDFAGWSKAALLDKTAPPAWSPGSIEDVGEADVAALFEPLEGWSEALAAAG
ncbi:MAG: enoyl-CoA hydratase [Caulobacter sp.]|nr:enoyl-CoA hydratase [Caulobacter sp.]